MIYKSYILENNLKAANKKLFLFYGENIGLKDDFKIKIKTNNSYKNCEFLNFEQDEMLKNDNILFNEISNISLFDKNKVFFITNATDKILEQIKEIEPLLEKQIIYLFSGVLEKKSKLRSYFEKSENCATIACYEDNEITIKKIIQERLKDFSGLTIQNINLILQSCNLDRAKLKNELKKIIVFFQDKKIETESLETLLDINLNHNFNLLKDQALLGNKENTNKLLSETIFEPEKSVLYLSLMNQRLMRIAEIKNIETNSIEKAVNSLKPPIFWKEKNNFISQANKWNKNKIKHALDKTYSLEKVLKNNSTIDKNFLLKKLIVDVCELANA